MIACMLCISGLAALAMYLGYDGAIFASALAAIGFLGGVAVEKKVINK